MLLLVTISEQLALIPRVLSPSVLIRRVSHRCPRQPPPLSGDLGLEAGLGELLLMLGARGDDCLAPCDGVLLGVGREEDRPGRRRARLDREGVLALTDQGDVTH